MIDLPVDAERRSSAPSLLALLPRPCLHRQARSCRRSTTRGSRRPSGRELRPLGAGRASTAERHRVGLLPGARRLLVRQPAVLDDQMAEIQRAGIDQIAVSWWGWGSPEDQRLPAVIAAAAARRHRRRHPHRAVPRPDGRRASAPTSTTSRRWGSRTFYVYQAFDAPAGLWAPANDALHAEGVTMFAPDGARRAGGRRPLQRHLHLRHRHLDGGGKFARLCSQAHARRACSARRRSGPGTTRAGRQATRTSSPGGAG